MSGFRLSPQQERLWTFQQSGRLAGRARLELAGPFRAEAARAAYARVEERYEILRTAYPPVPGLELPLQEIGTPAGELAVAEVSGAPSRLTLSLPALGADRATLELLAAELAAELAGRPALAGDVLQYADLAQWLNDLAVGEEMAEGRAFWRALPLAGELGLRLPCARSAAAESPALGSVAVPLPEELAANLPALAASAGRSLGGLVTAAWAALLARLSGRSELVLGAVLPGRTYEGLDRALGALERTLPLPVSAVEKEPFAELWGRVEAGLRSSAGWQECFAWSLIAARGHGGLPPFCALAVAHREAAPEPLPPGFELLAAEVESEPAELRLESRLQGGRLTLTLVHDPRLYAANEVRGIAGSLAALLAAVAAEPATAIGRLALVAPAEVRQLALAAAPRGPALVPVHRQVEHQAAVRPLALALVDEAREWTYRELNAEANRLAHRLAGLGLPPEARVATLLPRSGGVIVTFLGILKAGAAYVPLDPALPAERLRSMLASAGAEAVVTTAALADRLPEELGAELVLLDREAEALARLPQSDPAPGREAEAESLAYVLFTSGSTGKPKGVAVEHRHLAAYVAGVMPRLALPAGASWATVSTFAADLGNTAIYAALAGGGPLHVISEERLFDADAFGAYCRQQGIDALKIVPSHLGALLAAAEPRSVLPAKLLVLGGEASRWPWVEGLAALAPGLRILNHYGPTETTVGVLSYEVAAGERPSAAAVVPLGRPFDGVEAYVADGALAPLPAWVPGELLIGGRTVARGYIGRPAETAARFVPDPFSGRPGARLYRSGDLTRRLPGGEIEFLGRIDDQVKIHGFRIELAEIRAALASHPGVADCVVLAREDEAGERRLVAYTVPAGTMPAVAELSAHLARTLPEYMLPAAFVALPALPLTANGKLDRSRLPAPVPAARSGEGEFIAPATPTEEALAAVWAEVLGRERVSVTDSFFHLGGDSIRSIEVRSRARRRGLEVAIADLFRYPTVRELARQIGGTAPAEEGEPYHPFSLLSAEERAALGPEIEDAYPLCLMQQGMLFHSLASADAATYHDIGSYRFRMPADEAAFRAAARAVTARHAMLRTAFEFTRFGRPLQLVYREAELPVAVIDQRATPGAGSGQAWQEFLNVEVRTPFDWRCAPLFRLFLHALPEGVTQITVSFHHAILDGWSRHSIVTELLREYLRATGTPLPEPGPLPALAFGEFVALEQEALASAAHHEFWSAVIAGSERQKLPRREPLPQIGEGLGARVLISTLPAALSDGVHALAKSCGVPVKSVLLAATLRVLAELAGGRRVVTGLVVNGRPEKQDGDRASGLFLNTVPLAAELPRGDFRTLVRAAFEAEAAVLPFRRFPLAELQRRFGGGGELFETAFNYMHYHIYRGVLEAPEVEFLDYRGFEETNLACVFNFHQDPIESILQLGIEYHASVLWHEQVAKMARYLVALLEAMVTNPAASAFDLSPLSAAERHQLLVEWTATARPYPPALLHGLVEATVDAAPDAVALAAPGEQLSYGALEARANRLAARLGELGAGPEAPVALLLERSVEMVVAILGALKCGAAYVPLDPEQPPARLALLLADAAPAALLTTAALAPALPALALPRLLLDREPRLSGVAPRPALAIAADNAATIIFTSGSTGRPKGVINAHRGYVNRLRWGQETFPLAPGSRVLQKTPYSFDISLWEIFWPLSTGGRLVLSRPGGHRDAAYLARLIAEEAVSVVHFVPSMLQLFLEQGGLKASSASVERVICSGEALTPALAARCLERLGIPVIDLYGPTEAAIEVSCFVCPPAPLALVPIGRPIANVELHIATADQRPVAPGVAGELLIGGVALARGYLGRPALTAASFVPHPWSLQGGERLYRSGDLARHLPDGNVEYLGRLDHQVKVRGFRIELGEVEAALLALPEVREAAVAVVGEGSDRALAAYWVGEGEEPALKAALKASLPAHLVPTTFVRLERLPLTPNGKLDRKALPQPGREQGRAERALLPPRNQLERTIAAIWGEVLGLEAVSVSESFFDLGGHSLALLRVHLKLAEALGREIPMVDLFHYPTVRALAEHLAGDGAANTAAEAGRSRGSGRARHRAGGDDKIAIVGMSGRFPGAASVEEFWRNLVDGVESIVRLTPAELEAAGVPRATYEDPAYVPARGRLDGVDLFDAAFFGYSPLDATVIDPQQRLFLETAWAALEDAGYDAARYGGAIGLYAGVGMNSYIFELYAARERLAAVGGYQGMVANDKDFLATRASYKLGLSGPSMTVQTACSTSLVAVHLACQSLLAGECEMALAGGVRVTVPTAGYLYEEGGIHAPDGHCRAFDARAKGMVGGDGVGVVVLKRLADAVADGDSIRAVILGSAVNNDGGQRVGFTAPGVEGQTRVVAEALARAGVEPRTIAAIEAHGTGTELGDPIEVAALTAAFRAGTDERGFCALASLKTNVGHLDAAAGVAGLIKAALAVEEGLIPRSLHFEAPNPALGLADSPFYVNTELSPFPEASWPRRAGVSSLGIGGTNAHVVLEEPPAAAAGSASRPVQLLRLAARSSAALERQAARLERHLRAHPELELADVASTLARGRRAFAHRRTITCRDRGEALAALAGTRPELSAQGVEAEAEARPLAFLFPGQGAQYPGMVREVYASEATFRAALDHSAERLRPLLAGRDLRPLLLAAPDDPTAAAALQATELAQPALFAVEHALAQLWRSWGLEPDALLGHSIGELVAATLAGVFRLDDALSLVAARGRLMAAAAATAPPGAMLSAALSEGEALARAAASGGRLELAAVNAPRLTVLSGPRAAIEELAAELTREGIEHRPLATSHAFHSAAVEGAVAALTAAVAGVERQPPRLRFLSNLTGTWITAAEATDPAYWGAQLRRPVRFADGLAELLGEPRRLLLEVGPGRTLTSFARQHPARGPGHRLLHSLPPAREAGSDALALTTAIGRLWLAGVELDLERYYAGERRRRVPLPSYPFEGRRYWVERAATAAGETSLAPSPGLVRQGRIADWFFVPAWQRLPPLPAAPAPHAGEVAVLLDREGLGEELLGRLRARGARAVALQPGSRAELAAALRDTAAVVHLAGDAASLMEIALALAGNPAPPGLLVAASGLAAVVEGEPATPERGALAAVARVLGQEMPGLACRLIDLGAAGGGTWRRRTAAALAAELAALSGGMVAYRGAERWGEAFEPLALPPAAEDRPLSPGAVVLLLGDLEGPAWPFAQLLARAGARLVLVEEAVAHPERVEELRRSANVLWHATAPADPAWAAALPVEVRERFGRLDGVVVAPRGGAELGRPAGLAEVGAGALAATLAESMAAVRALLAACAATPPAFVFLLSSNASILGGLGALPLAAASAAADALATEAGDELALAVQWDLRLTAEPAAADPYAMSPGEALEVLHRLTLLRGRRRISVSPVDLRARIAALIAAAAAPPSASAAVAHPRPDLPQPYAAPRTATERSIAALWSELLGVAEVGIHDNFFDLGGHSLLATQLASRLRTAFKVEIPLRRLFDAPTVAALAVLVEEAELGSVDAAALAEMMAELKGMSPDEVQALIAAEGGGMTRR